MLRGIDKRLVYSITTTLHSYWPLHSYNEHLASWKTSIQCLTPLYSSLIGRIDCHWEWNCFMGMFLQMLHPHPHCIVYFYCKVQTSCLMTEEPQNQMHIFAPSEKCFHSFLTTCSEFGVDWSVDGWWRLYVSAYRHPNIVISHASVSKLVTLIVTYADRDKLSH